MGRRADVLEVLRTSGEAMSITAVAERLQVHPNTVRFHLDTLVESGRVEQVQATVARPGRPAQMFRARAAMDPAGPRNYSMLAEMLLASLDDTGDPVAAAERAGHRWGLRSGLLPADTVPDDAIGGLVGVLDGIGFAPSIDQPGGIAIRNCPFLELVQAHGRPICALHLGFMRGLMEGAGEPLRIRELIPFEAPDRCRVLTGESDVADTAERDD